jgi:hypothetical protein
MNKRKHAGFVQNQKDHVISLDFHENDDNTSMDITTAVSLYARVEAVGFIYSIQVIRN